MSYALDEVFWVENRVFHDGRIDVMKLLTSKSLMDRVMGQIAGFIQQQELKRPKTGRKPVVLMPFPDIEPNDLSWKLALMVAELLQCGAWNYDYDKEDLEGTRIYLIGGVLSAIYQIDDQRALIEQSKAEVAGLYVVFNTLLSVDSKLLGVPDFETLTAVKLKYLHQKYASYTSVRTQDEHVCGQLKMEGYKNDNNAEARNI